jgi:hypothetical protein
MTNSMPAADSLRTPSIAYDKGGGRRTACTLVLTQRRRDRRDGVQDRRVGEHLLCQHLQHLPVVAQEFGGVEINGPDAREFHVPRR